VSDAAVYRTDLVFQAHYLAEALNDAGIQSYVENENCMLGFGEVGLFPVHVRIRDRERLSAANRIVEELLRSLPESGVTVDAAPWKCACGQSIGAQFTACWNCGAERAGLA